MPTQMPAIALCSATVVCVLYMAPANTHKHYITDYTLHTHQGPSVANNNIANQIYTFSLVRLRYE